MDFEAAAKEFTRSAEAAEGDTAIARKRSRRVSFADTTAVRVFDRDEDYETPPGSKPGEEGSCVPGLGSEPVRFIGDFIFSEDTSSPCRRGEDGDDAEEDGREEEHPLFDRRDADSSSPGSTVGSLMSNDDDNIFGPVSTSFIRSGALSGTSDDGDHDITLDSTAFSMHFSSILPLDDQTVNTGGSPRTPTEDHAVKETGLSVPLSGTEQMYGQSGGAVGYSSDMTLVAEGSRNYDYEKLPPALEVLLAKVNKAMQPDNQNDSVSIISCSPYAGTGPSTDKIEQSGKGELHNLEPANVCDIAIFSSANEHPEKCHSFSCGPMPKHCLKDGTREDECRANVFHVSSPVDAFMVPGSVQLASVTESKASTPLGIQNGNQHACSPVGSSVSSLLTKRHQCFDDPEDASVSLQKRSMTQIPSSIRRDIALHREETSISSDDVSKFETLKVDEGLDTRCRTLISGYDKELHVSKDDEVGNNNCAISLNTSLSLGGERDLSLTGGVAALRVNCKMQDSQFSRSNVKDSKFLSTISMFVSPMTGKKHPIPQDQCFTPVASESIISDSFLKKVRSETPLSCVASSSVQKINLGNQNVTCEAAAVSQVTEKVTKDGRNLSPVCQDRDYIMNKAPDSPMEKLAGGRPVAVDLGSRKTMPMKEPEQVTDDQNLTRVLDFTEDNDIFKTFHLRNSGLYDPVGTNNMGVRQDIHSPPCTILGDGNTVLNKTIEAIPDVKDVGNVPGRTPKSLKCISDIKSSIVALPPMQQIGDNGTVEQLELTVLLQKLIEGTKEPFSPSINELTLVELDVLEDLVSQIQHVRKFERLSSDVQTLGQCHDLALQKRLSEIKFLKETLLYEQAKLQLKSIKHGRWLKKSHQLQSRVQNFCRLRSSFRQVTDKPTRSQSVPETDVMFQDEQDNVMTRKQELRCLNEKIKTLVNFFETSFKIDASLGLDEIIKAIDDILEKRRHNQIIHRNLHLWKLVGVTNQSDQYDILINYRDLLSQRFNMKVTSSSEVTVDISLNDVMIDKRFPNINASTAFHFIFNDSVCHKRLASLRCFQREFQATSFILGNLLDVLEEIQIAQIEIPNFMSSTFCAQSAGNLELQLYFVDVKDGINLSLSLDMTHLKRAVYPSDPSELKIELSSSNSVLPRSVSDEILGAVHSLKAGHLVLSRLCHCVSQLM